MSFLGQAQNIYIEDRPDESGKSLYYLTRKWVAHDGVEYNASSILVEKSEVADRFDLLFDRNDLIFCSAPSRVLQESQKNFDITSSLSNDSQMNRGLPIILGILFLCCVFWAVRHEGPKSSQNEILKQEAPRILESTSSVSIPTRRESRAAESADGKTSLWQEIQPIVEEKPYRYPGFGTPGSLKVNKYTRNILNLTPEEEKRLDDELLPQLFQRYGEIEARATEIKEDGDSSFLFVKGDPEAKLKFKNELYDSIIQELGEKRGYALFQMILRNSWFELAGVDREISFVDDGERFEIRDTVVNPDGNQSTRFSEKLYHDDFISSGRYNHLIDEEAWTQFVNNLPIK